MNHTTERDTQVSTDGNVIGGSMVLTRGAWFFKNLESTSKLVGATVQNWIGTATRLPRLVCMSWPSLGRHSDMNLQYVASGCSRVCHLCGLERWKETAMLMLGCPSAVSRLSFFGIYCSKRVNVTERECIRFWNYRMTVFYTSWLGFVFCRWIPLSFLLCNVNVVTILRTCDAV